MIYKLKSFFMIILNVYVVFLLWDIKVLFICFINIKLINKNNFFDDTDYQVFKR